MSGITHEERRQDTQSGFGFVGILLIVVGVGVLVAGGWVVYERNQVRVTGAAVSSNQTSNRQTGGGQPASPVAYLTVKEWDIKFPLPDLIKDAYYVPSVQNVAADGTPLAMYIGMKSLDAAGCDANSANVPGGNSTALGTIIRISPTDVDHVSGVEYVKEWPSATIGKYTYAFDDGTKYRTCASSDTLTSIGAAFSNAVKSAAPFTASAS